MMKNIWLDILAFLAIFFADLQGALLAIGFLILADTYTGIWASYKKEGMSSITSRKAGRIIAKCILYPLSLIVAKVSQEYLSPAIPWIDVTAGILAVIEVKSIFENMSLILGYDLWAKIKKQLWKDKTE
jgi:hypothetical protein